DRLCVRRQPEWHELLRALVELAALEQRVQNRVVAALEPKRVLIRRPSPELSDDRLRLALQGVDDTLCLGSADSFTVEGDVHLRDTADDLPVVVDRLAARLCELLLDRYRRALGDVGDDGHLRTARQA